MTILRSVSFQSVRVDAAKAPLCKGCARRRVSEANRRQAALRPEMSWREATEGLCNKTF